MLSEACSLLCKPGTKQPTVRDGPLENLWGGWGAGEVQKKNSRKGKLNEKKFMHAT